MSALALSAAPAVSAKAEAAAADGASFPTKDYDWTKHEWGFGVDATKCIAPPHPARKNCRLRMQVAICKYDTHCLLKRARLGLLRRTMRGSPAAYVLSR